ncbi:MAG: peroxiredoxin [Myxococcota bacterium]
MTVETMPSAPLLQLNARVPDFTATTTHGSITFSEWASGQWVILFSHPADFTPVCTTEFVAFAKLSEELKKRNVALIGNSVDSIYSHIAWMRNIEANFGVKVDFPVIADLDMKVATLFGMIHAASSDTSAVRAVYFIDPDLKLRAMIYYPLNIGRNFDEVVRVVDALQTADTHGVACPANWKPGDKVVVPPPKTSQDAAERAANTDFEVTDWYLSLKNLD